MVVLLYFFRVDLNKILDLKSYTSSNSLRYLFNNINIIIYIIIRIPTNLLVITKARKFMHLYVFFFLLLGKHTK